MAERHTGRTLREIVRVVASRFVGMAMIFIIVVGACAVATHFTARSYRSEGRLLARPAKMMNPLENRSGVRDEVSLFVVTQREIILSDYVLACALMRLEEMEIEADKADQQVRQWIGRNRKRLAEAYRRVEVVTPGGAGVSFTQTFKIRVDWPEERTEAWRRGVESRRVAAENAYRMATLIVEAYLSRYKDLEGRRARAAAKFLSDKSLATAEANLDKAITKHEQYIAQELKGDLPQVVQMLNRASGTEMGPAKLSTRSMEELNDIDARVAELTAIQMVIAREMEKEASQVVVPDIVTAVNDSSKEMQAKIVLLKLQLATLKSRYTDDYQAVRDLQTELLAVQAELRDEMKRHGIALGQEITVLKARRVRIQTAADKDRKRVGDLAVKVARYEQIQRQVAGAQTIYDTEQERVVSAVTAEKLAENPILVTVMDEPGRPDPTRPYRPIVWLNMLLAAGAGLVLALIYAFLSDYFDHTIKSIDEAERYLGVSVLASIPKLGRRIIRAG